MSSSGQQQDLFNDLPRGEQLAALRRLELDSWQRNSVKVSGKIQKMVLRVIDDHDGGRECFASQATIATEVGCSEASVGRAIAALIDRDLITKERPNHWSPNRHRVNWTAVMMIMRRPNITVDVSTRQTDVSCPHSDVSSYHTDVSDTSKIPVRDVIRTGPCPHSDVRNAPLNANLNAPTNRPAEWAAVVAEIFQWGLKSATTAVDAARERGLSVELVRELWREGGGDRDPKRWEPGQLSNWLTGKTDAPFDHDEAVRRIAERASEADRRDESAAESIRQRVFESGRMQRAKPDVIAGITYRKLREDGFERFATSNEIESGQRLDEIDRAREQPGPECREPSPDVAARSVQRAKPTSEPGEHSEPSEALFRPFGIPGVGVNQRRREIDRALRALG